MIRVLFGSFQGRVWFGFLRIIHFRVWVKFMAKPGFWFGSFLLVSFPSLNKTNTGVLCVKLETTVGQEMDSKSSACFSFRFIPINQFSHHVFSRAITSYN